MDHHLAQLNIAKMRYAYDDPRMAPFVELIAPVNAEAERAEGFVWRLKDDPDEDRVGRELFGADMLVNMSVWADARALRRYVAGGGHGAVMRRAKEWFDPTGRPQLVMWWVPAGHAPTMAEAKQRLDHLHAHGPTAEAFTLARTFPKPGEAG